MAKKTPWVLIIVGSVILIIVVCVGVLAVAGYYVYRQFGFENAPATAMSAERDFTEVLEKFKGQQPLLRMEDGEPVVRKELPVNPRAAERRVEAVHILVWQPDEGKVFRMNIPFWILRMSKGRPMHIGRELSEDGEPLRLNITARDIERCGPCLILDLTKPGRERVLVWAE